MNQDPPSSVVPLVPGDRLAIQLTASPPSNSQLTRWLPVIRRIDLVLVLLTVVLAGLLAAGPVWQSEIWQHLATGRHYVTHSAVAVHDPFSFSSKEETWVNTQWLHDVAAFLAFRTLGGTGLIFLRVALFALVSILLVRIGRVGRSLWLPVLGAILALLVMVSLVPMGPSLLSVALFAGTILILEQPRDPRDAAEDLRGRHFWALIPIILIWANVDEWFVLGLGATALRWITSPSLTRRAGVVLGGAMLSTLINPFHVRIFRIPGPLLEAWANPTGPWDSTFFASPLARSVGGFLFFALAALVVMALFVNRDGTGRSVFRILLAGGLLILAFVTVNGWPYFAVVAGPMFARSWQEWSHRRYGDEYSSNLAFSGAVSGRVMTLLMALALPFLSWAGWLQAAPFAPRTLTHTMDPTLARLGERFSKSDLIGAARCFNLSSESAHALAWGAPGVRTLVDARSHLFTPGILDDQVKVRHALLGADETGLGTVREILKRHEVFLLLVHDPDRARGLAMTRRLLLHPEEFEPLDFVGSAALFRWHPARDSTQKFGWLLGAFDTDPVGGKPLRLPVYPEWSEPLRRPVVMANADRDEAMLHVAAFDASRVAVLLRHREVWQRSLAASLVTAPTPTELILNTNLVVAGAMKLPERAVMPVGYDLARLGAEFYTSDRDQGTVEHLWIALRLVRRAIAADPDDDAAWRTAGDIYVRLSSQSAERGLASWFALNRLRKSQAIASYTLALQRNPRLDPARLALAELYQIMNQPELALNQYRLLQSAQRRTGPQRRETTEQFQRRMDLLEQRIQLLDADVKRRRDIYALNAEYMKVLDRAKLAVEQGLSQTALDVLLKADFAAFGAPGLELELDLLLLTGRIADAASWLDEEHKKAMGEFNFRYFRVRLAASTGDYTQADAELELMIQATKEPRVLPGEPTLPVRARVAESVANCVLDGCVDDPSPIGRVTSFMRRYTALNAVRSHSGLLRQEAELNTLRGLLAFEAGDGRRAAEFLRRGQAIGPGEAEILTGSGIDFQGRRLGQRLVEKLEAMRK